MNISIPIENKDKTILRIQRNWFTGSFYYTINDGPRQTLRSVLDPLTHFDLKITRQYNIVLEDPENSTITLKHTRPALFAGFRPHHYEFYLDGKLIKDYKGY